MLEGGIAHYKSSGNWVSKKQYLGQVSAWSIFLADYKKNDQPLNIYMRSATSEGGLDTATWYLIDNNQVPNESSHPVGDTIWVQFKVTLETNDVVFTTPVLYSVILQYYTGGNPTQEAVAWVFQDRYLLACASRNMTYNNMMIVLDRNNAWTKFSGLNVASLCRYGEDLIGGASDTDGVIYQLFTTYNDNFSDKRKVDTGSEDLSAGTHNNTEYSANKIQLKALNLLNLSFENTEFWEMIGTADYSTAEAQDGTRSVCIPGPLNKIKADVQDSSNNHIFSYLWNLWDTWNQDSILKEDFDNRGLAGTDIKLFFCNWDTQTGQGGDNGTRSETFRCPQGFELYAYVKKDASGKGYLDNISYTYTKKWGEWISDSMYLPKIISYINLSVTDNKPAGTDIKYYTRTSDDGVNWDDWMETGDEYSINSLVKPYIQVKVYMETNDEANTPDVSAITINLEDGNFVDAYFITRDITYFYQRLHLLRYYAIVDRNKNKLTDTINIDYQFDDKSWQTRQITLDLKENDTYRVNPSMGAFGKFLRFRIRNNENDVQMVFKGLTALISPKGEIIEG